MKVLIFLLFCHWVLLPGNVATEEKTLVSHSYSDEFFQQFNPQTALDMVKHIPGFNLDTGDNVRGFGAGAGNVLIDGNRPTSKRGGIQDALLRVPASQVLRIELIRGSASTGEAAGQSIVANVIRKEISTSVRWESKLEVASDGSINPICRSKLFRPHRRMG